MNREIRFAQILVIGPEGEQLGVMSPDEGRAYADERGLDLVEVAPDSRPPVCRVMDYGKYKYELSKKAKPQKTAYEIASCLVGSEMCIRDSLYILALGWEPLCH